MFGLTPPTWGWGVLIQTCVVTSTPQTGRHFADDILKCTFVNEKFCILNYIRISLKFVSNCPIDKKPVLFQIMAWCRPADMLLRFKTKHIASYMHVSLNVLHVLTFRYRRTTLAYLIVIDKTFLCWNKPVIRDMEKDILARRRISIC